MYWVRVMAWSIHYKHRGVSGYRAVSALALAIQEACKLLDQGANVSEIVGPSGDKIMGTDDIRRICAEQPR
jgi:hypothetical protein